MKLLVVDDNLDAAESLRMLLELTEHEVDCAYSGPAAVERATSRAYDAIICDIGLPGDLDGFGVAQILRQNKKTQGIRLIALSGHGQDADRKASLNAGFHTHLVKPASLDQIQAALSDLPAEDQLALDKHPAG